MEPTPLISAGLELAQEANADLTRLLARPPETMRELLEALRVVKDKLDASVGGPTDPT